MINKTHFLRQSNALLILLFVTFLVATALLSYLPSWRIDLTEDKLYTLDSGTVSMLKKINEPIQLTFYFSDKASAELPQQRSYAQRVRELLYEYQRLAPDYLSFQEVDPEPFSEAEDQAADLGLQGVAASAAGDLVYFGLVAERETRDVDSDSDASAAVSEKVGFFLADRESYLEYDISQLIYRVSQNKKKTVATISSLPLLQQYQQAQQPGMGWLAIQQLQKTMTLDQLPDQFTRIDDNIDILLIVQPPNFDEATLYAIDQYILGGGATLIFVDPNAEMAAATPMAGAAPYPSDMPKLLSRWGVGYDPSVSVGDARWGLKLPAGETGIPLAHIGIIGLQQDSINREDLVSAELETINVSSSGYFLDNTAAQTHFIPLLTSSSEAEILSTEALVTEKDHSKLLQKFVASGDRYTVMARINGRVNSVFAESPVAEVLAPHINSGDINVIISADTDMLSDRLWVQVSNFFGESVAAPWANNGDLLVNAVDNMSGSKDLISVRSRGVYSRPFTRVEALQLQAAERFRAQENNLMQKLADLELAISSLGGINTDSSLDLTPEQQAQVAEFEQQRLQTRRELRQVQHQLNSDIQTLERRLMFVNTLLVPLILTLLLLLWWGYKRIKYGQNK